MIDKPFIDYRWLILFIAGLGIIGLVRYVGGISVETGVLFLGTLATVQAAIFAIVFSVVILGVQLSASRYSPRLASTFKSDPDYRWCVGIFGVSIGFSLAAVFSSDLVSRMMLTEAVVWASMLAIGAFWTLYSFVGRTLEKTTPEGILDEIRNGMTTESMKEDTYEFSENSYSGGPFLTLLNVILSAISERDRDAASYGLLVLSERISDLLETQSAEEFGEGGPLDESLEDLCVERIPNVAEEAVGQGLTQTGIEVVNSSKEIGGTAGAQALDRPVEHVVLGLSKIVNEVGYSLGEERIRAKAIDFSSDVLKSAADHRVWLGAARGTRYLGWLSAGSLVDRQEGYNRYYTSVLILGFPKLVRKVIDSGENIEDRSSSRWLRAFILDEFDPSELLVAAAYGSMAELSSAAIRYEIRTGDSSVRWEQVAYGWTECFESLYNAEMIETSKLWLGTILYLEYLRDVSPEDVMEGFTPRAGMIVDGDTGIATLQDIVNGDVEARSKIDFIPGGVDPVEMPLTGSQVSPVRDAEISFEDWLAGERVRLGMDGQLRGWGGSLDDSGDSRQ